MEEISSRPVGRRGKEVARERIWVTKAVKDRLETLSEANNTNQESILSDVLDFYDLSTGDSLQTTLPELELSVAVLNAELGRFLHLLELLEDTAQNVPDMEAHMQTVE